MTPPEINLPRGGKNRGILPSSTVYRHLRRRGGTSSRPGSSFPSAHRVPYHFLRHHNDSF